MAPDSDLKDRIDRPGQNIVPDKGVYAEPVAEDDDNGEEDEDGEGRASFALDTPEPAIPAMTGPEMPGGKVEKKARKAKKNSKSPMGARFAEIAPVMIADEISTALAINIDEKIFSADGYLSAFDRDEVTDTPTDLMNILFSAGERPWENESLSAAERMAMMKVLRTNFPDAQKRAEREEFEYRIRARSNNVRTANVAAVVVAAAKSQVHTPEDQTPKLKTLQKTKTESPASLEPIRLVTPREPFTREYGQPEEIYKVDRNLNAALGIGSIIGMPSSLAMLNMKAKPEANQPPVNYLGLAEIVASQMPVQPEIKIEVQERIIPQILSRDTGFVRALRMIYEAIAPEILMKVAPYREVGWSDKYMEQKKNIADMTIRTPEVAPAIRPHYEMNISVPAFK